MKSRFTSVLVGLLCAGMPLATAQNVGLYLPKTKTIEAGSAFSVRTTGAGKAVLYLVSPAQVLRRTLQLGETISFNGGELHNVGRYAAALVADSATSNGALDVVAARPASLSFLAKPSRIPVDQHDGISGVVYVMDIFHNLVLAPTEVSFQLSGVAGAGPARTVTSRNGVAWTKMDSTGQQGAAHFVARVGSVSQTRVIEQVPGDPCTLKISARLASQWLNVETEPVRDCSGNPIPDGTIVSFTETYDGGESTVDVPVKRGIARTEMPAYPGARISVATGVVVGNEIRWGMASGVKAR